MALVLSLGILVIFQTLRLIFGADFLSFGIFTTPTANLLGKWNDLGIFLGLTIILSLITLEGLSLNKLSRIILIIILAVSVGFLTIINFFPVWLLVGLFSLGLLVYSLSKNVFKFGRSTNTKVSKEDVDVGKNKGRTPSIIVLAISVAFIVAGSLLGGYTSSLFSVSQIEARPSWQSTIDITKQTYKESLLFGSGPNTFSSQWTKLKEQSINNTLFWNIDFESGVGFVPTSFTTTGLVGGLAWIAFFIFLLYSGFKNLIVSAIEDKASYYLSMSLFLGSIYLWVFTIIYIPNIVIVTFAFLLTGMYIASLRHRPSAPIEKTINFASNPRIGFVSILALTVLLIISAVSLYMVGGQYASAVAFQGSLVAANVEGDIDKAEKKVSTAIKLGNNDRYNTFAAEINLARINAVLSDEEKDIEERRAEFQNILASAISNVQEAIAIDDKNYQNWSMLGRVYGSVVPLGVEGAYESAQRSYAEALALNPHNPEIFLTLAQLELAKNNENIDGAKEFISLALQKKNNYTEAIFLLSQLEIQAGNIEGAIRSVEAAVVIEPNNPTFFFQLGLLQANAGDGTKSIAALERAVELNPQYSNARYFLGVNYFNVDRVAEAIIQFTEIAKLNPGNEDVKAILEGLKAGEDPFQQVQADQLPIEGE
ncbi:MAG: tetratricopeptide repeat protein [Candidatus Jacksonbacteria bacterium]|nr:tetratricopeptide repeat protein [Candidatus Jacksonbacteria bacterium]